MQPLLALLQNIFFRAMALEVEQARNYLQVIFYAVVNFSKQHFAII